MAMDAANRLSAIAAEMGQLQNQIQEHRRVLNFLLRSVRTMDPARKEARIRATRERIEGLEERPAGGAGSPNWKSVQNEKDLKRIQYQDAFRGTGQRQSSGSISIHVKRRVASFVPPFVSWSVPLLVVAAAAEDEVANQGGIEDLFLSAFASLLEGPEKPPANLVDAESNAGDFRELDRIFFNGIEEKMESRSISTKGS
ncbi:hypothetical protein EZV62_028241 [Acer yangbiense]|uniref:Uncharacterized protein n=1 Tax=Acer yangbiense TaxID=1000413 RepID=A0A5C7GNQ0_9ROSI|nr:hypothetical protein EZV62_028241 [Acer yangbiense]